MGTTALIACDHGYGHVRRCLMIASELADRGEHVTLFAPTQAVERFSELLAHSVEVIDFATHTTVDNLKAGRTEAAQWQQRLPSLEDFDMVVSDNLVEVLALRPDAVLSGGFLWHQALPGVDPGIKARAVELVRACRPVVVSSRLFTSEDLVAATSARLVGLCAAGPRPDEQGGEDLLIACGGAAIMDQAFRAAVAELARIDTPPPFPVVWVDEKLMPQNPPRWMRPAMFGPELYRRLSACVCRPGVGTLSDALWARARVFCVYEDGNNEMSLNARRIAAAEVGETCATPADALVAASIYAIDPDKRVAHGEAVRNLDFDGVAQTVDILLEIAAKREH